MNSPPPLLRGPVSEAGRRYVNRTGANRARTRLPEAGANIVCAVRRAVQSEATGTGGRTGGRTGRRTGRVVASGVQ